MVEHTPGYEVTADGHVFSVSSNWRGYGRRELRQHPNSYGYPAVRLTINQARRKYLVHRLVANKFLPPRPSPQHEIRHLDGEPTNNNASNLAWGTQLDNAADRERHGRTSHGHSHSVAIKRGIQKSNNPYWRHAR